MAVFSNDYFEPQVVDNFYIRPMVKRAWAAQLEVLEEIAKVCKRHNLKYYAEWGTLLGAVRHQGFIPWDDDLDIGMLRSDFEKFYQYAKQEFPKELEFLSIRDDDNFSQLLFRVINSRAVNISTDFLEKYHGCPYSMGVDIFITDYIPNNKEDEYVQLELMKVVYGLAKNWNDYEDEDRKWQNLRKVSELTGVKFDTQKSIPNQLYRLVDQLSSLYKSGESQEVAIIPLLSYEQRYRFPKSCYSDVVEVPFENTTIPIPVGYEQILVGRYGQNYMIPIKRWGTHDYPFFKEQEKMLVNFLREKDLSIPYAFDIMPSVEKERFIGFQYHPMLEKSVMMENGLPSPELSLTDLEDYQNKGYTKLPKGLRVSATLVLELGATSIIDAALSLGAVYIVIDTTDFWEFEALDEALTSQIVEFRWKPITCYIENSYATDIYGRPVRSPYSEVAWLNETIDAYNMLCGRDCFGICLNVGHANLLSDNLRAFAEAAGERLGLIHMNDNDGNLDMHQMPFTFTNGRGSRSTDIYRLIGTLVRMDYQGGIVFDVSGFWEKAPVPVQRPALRLLQALGKEWEEQFQLKEKLGQKDKKIILFGTGAMAYNYIVNWAKDYPPYRMVDNNQNKWGQEFFGVPIVSPETILEIPPEERNVFICNMYYSQIATQLEQMGIDYDMYNDNYYM